jgi:hypothetical protein
LWKAVISALLLSVPGMPFAQVKEGGKVTELPPVVVTTSPFKDRSVISIWRSLSQC